MLAEHKGNGDSVYLPAAAFAECCHLDPGLFKLLRVLTLNAGAARLANQLFPPFLDERKKLKAKTPIKRKEVCIDAMILATAEVAGAELLYTTDDWFERVAKRAHLKVDVRTLPELRPKQLVLKEPTPEEEELAASVAEGDEAEEEEEREQERLEP
jgi:predicted nucleic acid-binding protein